MVCSRNNLLYALCANKNGWLISKGQEVKGGSYSREIGTTGESYRWEIYHGQTPRTLDI